jgi:hypothetical protein
VLPTIAVAGFLAAVSPAEGAITVSASGASLSNFGPGQTATGSGALTVTDDNPGWTLQAEDQGTGAGKMVAAASGCSGSDPILADPLGLAVTSQLAGVTPAPAVTLGSSNQTVASASNQALLTPTILTTHYTQVIPLTEPMRVACSYTIAVTYTLQ